MLIQGREITLADIRSIGWLINANPSWNRTRLSKELCRLWDWRAANGQIKDMACRAFLRKLEQRGYIALPARQPFSGRGSRKVSVPDVPPILITSTPSTGGGINANFLLGLPTLASLT